MVGWVEGDLVVDYVKTTKASSAFSTAVFTHTLGRAAAHVLRRVLLEHNM